MPYEQVYTQLADRCKKERKTRGRNSGRRTAREGIFTTRKWFKDYMASLGFRWVACMAIGSGCKVHLREDELPTGRLICSVSRHYTAVIDGVIHDTHDPQRFDWYGITESDKEFMGSSRCVYGYWIKI